MATNGRTPVYYVYDIPYTIRHRLCMVLDAGGEWRTLAGELQYSSDYVRWLALALQRPGGSPTDDLLRDWGQSNATVTSLFRHLHSMHHYRALSILRDLVPEEMYRDIDLGSGVGEERDLRQPRHNNEINHQREQKHTCELPAPEFPHFPIQDQQNIPNNTAQTLPQTAKAGEHGDEGYSVISYSDNQAYSSSLESQAIAEQEKCLKDAANKQPVESADISYNSDLKALSQSAALMNTQHFSYNNIKQATYGFHDSNLLGKGGFGTVYKGIMRNTTFAIKLLKNKPGTNVTVQQQQHMVEIKALLRYRHDNIIQLCGYSMDGAQLCLVYQFMENGSLENRLMCKDNTKPLGWALRHHILTGSARGIQYLHSLDDKPLIHGDIKSANILLDHHFDPKVADFGLAKEATSQNQSGRYTHVSRQKGEKMFGSPAYLPDEFYTTYQFSIKTDTYSFGVVIYETCTGELAMEEKREGGKKLKDYVDKLRSDNQDEFQQRLRDKKAADWPPQSWDKLMGLGQECTNTRKKERPTMQAVLSRLEEIEAGAKTALANAPAMTEDFTHYSYASEGQGQNNLAANVENSKPSLSDLETITNVEPNHSDPDMLSYDRRKLELDSSSDVSGNVADSEDCSVVDKLQKLGLDPETSTCTVTPSDRGLDQSSNQTPDQNPPEPSRVPQELDEGSTGSTETAVVGDTGCCLTMGEESMQLQGLMKDLSRYGVGVSSSVEDAEWASDNAEICRKSLKKRPQFVQAIFAMAGDQCNGADPDSQLTQSEGKQQQQTESTDLYSPPSVQKQNVA